MTACEPAPELVTREWPDIVEVPVPDARIEVPNGHIVIYVRRYSGSSFFTLVGVMAQLVVDEAARKGGIGSGLVRDALRWLRTHEIPYAVLNCERELVPFYQRHEFREAGNIPGPGVSMVSGIGDRYGWPNVRIDYREPW